MSGQGSGGNVLAALCSLFIPGLGQLLQGRLLMAVIQFFGAIALWMITCWFLGWVANLWSIIDAARFSPSTKNV
jgi:TM2 domain-containing membrane protein YozV